MVCLMSAILLHISFTLLVNLRAWRIQANVSNSKDKKNKSFILSGELARTYMFIDGDIDHAIFNFDL